jgi:hypothetical protein
VKPLAQPKAEIAKIGYCSRCPEVYSVIGEPLLVEDLGFPDRRILENAFDAVINDVDQVQRLYAALANWTLRRRWEVTPPPGFRDPGKVQMCGTMYPKLLSTSTEGERVWKLSRQIERDRRLVRDAKALNKSKNGGVLVCEACKFSDFAESMFDAHHQDPLAAGIRESRIDDLAILCPTCHRWAHAKGSDKLWPVSVQGIARARSIILRH